MIEEELPLCGYFVIITSHKMTAKEAIELYKSRDSSEKLFRGDKSYLGNRSLRVQSDEVALAKIFVEFVTLVIWELEKIEMIRQADGRYCLGHLLTATQKTILKAFQMDGNYIRKQSEELSRKLEENKKEKGLEKGTDGKTEGGKSYEEIMAFLQGKVEEAE